MSHKGVGAGSSRSVMTDRFRVTVYIDESEKQEIQDAAAKERLSVSAFSAKVTLQEAQRTNKYSRKVKFDVLTHAEQMDSRQRISIYFDKEESHDVAQAAHRLGTTRSNFARNAILTEARRINRF